VGFSDAAFDDADGRIVVVGHGWMPREHETRIYAWNYTQTPVRSRWFRLTCEPPVEGCPRIWQVELVVDPSLPETGRASDHLRPNDIYTGVFTADHRLIGKSLQLEFDNVRLAHAENPSQTITVSGVVKAHRAYPERIATMHRKFKLAFHYR